MLPSLAKVDLSVPSAKSLRFAPSYCNAKVCHWPSLRDAAPVGTVFDVQLVSSVIDHTVIRPASIYQLMLSRKARIINLPVSVVFTSTVIVRDDSKVPSVPRSAHGSVNVSGLVRAGAGTDISFCLYSSTLTGIFLSGS
jgi:hypothetical protein